MKRMIVDGSRIGSNNVVSNGYTFTTKQGESAQTRYLVKRGFPEIVFRGFYAILICRLYWSVAWVVVGLALIVEMLAFWG